MKIRVHSYFSNKRAPKHIHPYSTFFFLRFSFSSFLFFETNIYNSQQERDEENFEEKSFEKFLDPYFSKSPELSFEYLLPLDPWSEEKGGRGKKGGVKKMHKRRTNDRQDSSWTNFRGKSFLRTTTIGPQPSGSQISPHPLQLALVFSPSGYRGPRVTNWSMPHTRPRCSTPREASLWVVEPREIPRPITCGSQLWIN